MIQQVEEEWGIIPEFPNYMISSKGRIYNRRYDLEMRVSKNNFGHLKITLTDEETGERYDRSVVKLVAETFCEPPNSLCDRIVVLDGDLTHAFAENLVWRPRSFAWQYSRQLKEDQPRHYHNLRIMNKQTGVRYSSVIQTGMTEGLLFDDIWRSTYTGDVVFPHSYSYEVI